MSRAASPVPHREESRHRLQIVFGAQVEETVRRRMDYSFRLFCAVYGFRADDGPGALRLGYGTAAGADATLTAAYRPRPPREPASPPRAQAGRGPGAGAGLPRFHPPPDPAAVDWLGEIFEWASAAHEHAVTGLDGAGRVPFAAGLAGRFGLDPRVPFAAVAMEGLNAEIRRAAGPGWPAGPASPWGEGAPPVLAATHDIDFLPVRRLDAATRLGKNLLLALAAHRDPRLFLGILRRVPRLLGGGGAQMAPVRAVRRREMGLGVASTWTVVCGNAHRRDPGYILDDPPVLDLLRELAGSGAEVGVHGSYTSLDEDGSLSGEYLRLRRAGFPAVGGRQHWLRYRPGELFNALRQAGAWYDCSAGWSDRVGFRNGASFPFPPYDFHAEGPYPFLEIPLVVMDGALYQEARGGEAPATLCRQVLQAVRRHGWGGVSVLWHDTALGGGQIPEEIGALYWDLLRGGEAWGTARALVQAVWGRYASCGLLPPSPPSHGGGERGPGSGSVEGGP